MWKRLLAGLRIRERIEGYDIEGERDFAANKEMNRIDDDEQEDEGAGGFLPDRDAEDAVDPTAGRLSYKAPPDLVKDGGGGLMAETSGEDSTTPHEVDPPRPRDPFINNLDDDDGGGFLVNDEHADDEEALQEAMTNEHDASRLEFTKRSEIETKPNPTHEQEASHEGGFVPEDNPELDHTTHVNASVAAPGINRNQDKFNNPSSSSEAFTSIPNEELEEARMLQQLYETGGMAHSPLFEDTTLALPSDPFPEQASRDLQMETMTALESSSPRPNPESVASSEGERRMEDAAKSESSYDDKGSLLSHDPDDEDADPE